MDTLSIPLIKENMPQTLLCVKNCAGCLGQTGNERHVFLRYWGRGLLYSIIWLFPRRQRNIYVYRMAAEHGSQSKRTLVKQWGSCGLHGSEAANAPGSPWVADGQLYQWRVPPTEWTTCKSLHYWEVPWEQPSPTVPPSPQSTVPSYITWAGQDPWGSQTTQKSGDSMSPVCFLVKNLMGLVSLYWATLSPSMRQCWW